MSHTYEVATRLMAMPYGTPKEAKALLDAWQAAQSDLGYPRGIEAVSTKPVSITHPELYDHLSEARTLLGLQWWQDWNRARVQGVPRRRFDEERQKRGLPAWKDNDDG